MDYSNVTTEQLRAKREGLFVDLSDLIAEEDLLSVQINEIETELTRRAQGTTDDRAEWQNVGVR